MHHQIDRRRATAIHEAGHAVVGRVLKMTCGDVSISLHTGESAPSGAVVADPTDTQSDWAKIGKLRDIRSAFRGRMMTHMAGAEAEIEFCGRLAKGDGDDRLAIELIAKSEGALGGETWKRYEPRMRRHVHHLVRRNWKWIMRVAVALMLHGRVTAIEVDNLK
jgi:hypothetical protein